MDKMSIFYETDAYMLTIKRGALSFEFKTPISEGFDEILAQHGIDPSGFYVTSNGCRIPPETALQKDKIYHVIPRVLGGKGGFGSMLRAIGAQIEKTTNREACRDLSGRRMRDVNNEQQLRDWVKDKAEREREKEERRKERAEKRKRALTDTRHTFDDQDYHKQKMQVLEGLEDALSQGLRKTEGAAASSSSNTSSQTKSRKRKSNNPGPEAIKKACEWLGVDEVNLSDLSDSDSEADSSDIESCNETASRDKTEDDKAVATSEAENNDNSSLASSSHTSQEKDNTNSVESNSRASTGKDETKQSGLLGALSKIPPKETLASEPKSKDNEQICKDQESCDKTSQINPEEPVTLEEINSSSELEKMGLDRLKFALMTRGLKCGGTLQQRAERLWSVKGKSKEEIDPSLFAKPSKNKKK